MVDACSQALAFLLYAHGGDEEEDGRAAASAGGEAGEREEAAFFGDEMYEPYDTAF